MKHEITETAALAVGGTSARSNAGSTAAKKRSFLAARRRE